MKVLGKGIKMRKLWKRFKLLNIKKTFLEGSDYKANSLNVFFQLNKKLLYFTNINKQCDIQEMSRGNQSNIMLINISHSLTPLAYL